MRARGRRIRAVLPPRRIHARAVRRAGPRRRTTRGLNAAGGARLAAAALAGDRPDPRHVVCGPPPRERRRRRCRAAARRAGRTQYDRGLMADWSTIAPVGTAAGTLELARPTLSSVRVAPLS